MRILITCFTLLLLAGCGGGGGGGSSTSSTPTLTAPTPMMTSSLPSGTWLRSDLFKDGKLSQEGTSALPLEVAPCLYPYASGMIVGQSALCINPPLIFKQSNAFQDGDNYFTWRASFNNETAADNLSVNTGPPNQSRKNDGSLFSLTSTETTFTLKLDVSSSSDNAGKLPYLAIAYVRGAQGDPIKRIAAWGDKPTVAFTAVLKRVIAPESPDTQWVHVWFYFRAKTGERLMLNHVAYGESSAFGRNCAWPAKPSFEGCYMWNWPLKNSYHYPGGSLIRKESDGTNVLVGETPMRLSFDVESMARSIYPNIDGLAPDFIGFEIAIEQGYRAVSSSRMMTQVTLSDFAATNFKLQ